MSAAPQDDSLLIYAPVPLHGPEGALTLERQACNGLHLWAENFERVIAVLPHAEGPAPPSWRPISEVGPSLERIELVPIPEAFRPDRFARAYRAGRALWRAQIPRARYLSFAIGGLFGDWGAVGALEARAQGRRFAVWTDRVESEVVRRTARSSPLLRRRVRDALTWRPMRALERAVIRRADLGLFHGRETFEAYAPYCGGPSELVHDIHISREDHIGEERLRAKARDAAAGPLRIAYAGRADPMKGPGEWIETLARLDRAGVSFEATWLGEGSERAAMLRRIEEAGLGGKVSAPGHVDDPAAVHALVRGAHIFLFCHKTPESPRNLIEALVGGAPIVGYESAYPADLICGHGGGVLVPLGDAGALAEAVLALDRDRARLARLIEAAAADGAPFEDRKVFAHRSDVIKRHLGRRPERGEDPDP